MHKHTNHLAVESSPYLLQHAHNPVNWYPWGEEALALAEKENKPILVSIGYSSCHWCHVMERESFEDETTAEIMNEHFINIKIDREERPDLDHIYMDAVQAMTGSGGWPLNVFLTPDRKPFYGGTYFPPKKAFNRPSWQDVLLGVSNAFQQKRDEIDAQAENLIGHLQQANLFGKSTADQKDIFTKENIETAFTNIMKTADRQWGGFGSAPKFPQTFSIQFLLRHHRLAKNKEALEQALLSLDKMINGGIYDQAGGGFARYSTDSEWLVPHFEKMLYDNALLVSVISEAFAITENERYAEVIGETILFLQREMMHTAGGFYAALDADSEGEEGKFYVWGYEEVKKILDGDAEIFCTFFDITPGGNWEGKNILWRKKTEENFCKEKNIRPDELKRIIISGKEKLMEKRSERIRPQLDDKIILGWNALMNAALSKAFAATGNSAYRQLAIKNMDFLLMAFKEDLAPRLFHTWKNEEPKYNAFLDDYAYLIQALILLQEITGETKYLMKAKELTGFVIDHFSDEQRVYFYFTSRDQEDVIIRKKEIYDGAQPSGNSVMAENLLKLSLYFDLPEWGERASACIRGLEKAIINYPTSFGGWLSLMQQIVHGTHEIAIVGPAFQQKLDEILPLYIPHKIIMCSEKESSLFSLLADKKTGGSTLIYLCRHYACQKPVTNVAELMPFLA